MSYHDEFGAEFMWFKTDWAGWTLEFTLNDPEIWGRGDSKDQTSDASLSSAVVSALTEGRIGVKVQVCRDRRNTNAGGDHVH